MTRKYAGWKYYEVIRWCRLCPERAFAIVKRSSWEADNRFSLRLRSTPDEVLCAMFLAIVPTERSSAQTVFGWRHPGRISPASGLREKRQRVTHPATHLRKVVRSVA